MKTSLQKIALRKNAILVHDNGGMKTSDFAIHETTSVLVANCAKLGFGFSEELLHGINNLTPKEKIGIFNLLTEVTGVNKNWTPLVKQWDTPTGESITDHIITWFSNIFQSKKGTQLACGHIIPEHTFPLERYNGCPFCGTPFEFEELTYEPRTNKLKVLDLWTEEDLKQYMNQLLQSPVALDATQVDDLKMLLGQYSINPGVTIKMKETLMIVIDSFVENGKPEEAGSLFKTPNDVLRYLWFKHTGLLQIIEPKTIVQRIERNSRNSHSSLDQSSEARLKSLEDLKLKFKRTECKQYAGWLNGLEMDVKGQCETMHPKRGIWVRVIRALRLAEYSKKKGFEKLATLLDTFYNEQYDVWQGKVNAFKLKSNADETFKLLKQRPGLFARSLFSNMLWFGPEKTISEFQEVLHLVPPRLIFTLGMYAETYFVKNTDRVVKPLGGVPKRIPGNELLKLYSDEDLANMQLLVSELSKEVIMKNFKSEDNSNSTIFIDESLFSVPIAIGDRNEQIQDLPGALMGTRFKLEGNKVRLFLQWGEGLPAQHLDMDLSCRVAYDQKSEVCSYMHLSIPGCKHSGDIQYIPEKVGTAEYIEIDMDELTTLEAKYVSFTCNAYSNGSIAPNAVVGWMNSAHPMKISSTGVAYNPTTVQHQVRIKKSLTKGMVFGVLDVKQREIIWMEMDFEGQIVQNLNLKNVESFLKKLDAKIKIGDLLKSKAEAQQLTRVPSPELADEVYDVEWALNTAQVSQLFLEPSKS